MSKFIPCEGDLLYAKRKTKAYTNISSEGVATKVVNEDQSWGGSVFRCTGRDDVAIVVIDLTSKWSKEPVVMKIEYYEFSPVGPSVANALGIKGE